MCVKSWLVASEQKPFSGVLLQVAVLTCHRASVGPSVDQVWHDVCQCVSVSLCVCQCVCLSVKQSVCQFIVLSFVQFVMNS